MASRVVMPKLTDTMTEGVLIRWYKREGDKVDSGDVLAEIETDKAIMDLEAYASGVMRKILVGDNATVPAGGLIAVIASGDEDISSILSGPASELASAPNPEPVVAKAVSSPKKPMALEPLHEIKASPLARKIAQERGIDLRSVRGSGPEGRIVERDLQEAMMETTRETAPLPSPSSMATGKRAPLSQMRKAIVRNMTASKSPVPHFYLTIGIEMHRADDLLQALGAKHPDEKVGYNDLIIKACSLALAKHSRLNASFAGDGIVFHEEIHIGVAVGLDDGLVVPVIRNCGKKTLQAIASEGRDLVQRARGRKLKPEEYSGATFSISSLGKFDIEHFIAIITPPEAAVLAVGSVKEAPVVEEGRVVVRKRMMVTLSCDHRVVDGMQAALFLQELKRVLENAFDMLVE